MSTYAFYYQFKQGKFRELVGTDGMCYLDGRLSLQNQIIKAANNPYKNKFATHFKIYRGSNILDAKPINNVLYEIDKYKTNIKKINNKQLI